MRGSKDFMVNPGWSVMLADLGVTAANVLRRAGLPGDLLARGSVPVSAEEFYALWEALEEEAPDVHLPVRIGQVISVEVLDPPVFAAFCSRNLSYVSTTAFRINLMRSPG